MSGEHSIDLKIAVLKSFSCSVVGRRYNFVHRRVCGNFTKAVYGPFSTQRSVRTAPVTIKLPRLYLLSDIGGSRILPGPEFLQVC